jgi:hypothetical protein
MNEKTSREVADVNVLLDERRVRNAWIWEGSWMMASCREVMEDSRLIVGEVL